MMCDDIRIKKPRGVYEFLEANDPDVLKILDDFEPIGEFQG